MAGGAVRDEPTGRDLRSSSVMFGRSILPFPSALSVYEDRPIRREKRSPRETRPSLKNFYYRHNAAGRR